MLTHSPRKTARCGGIGPVFVTYFLRGAVCTDHAKAKDASLTRRFGEYHTLPFSAPGTGAKKMQGALECPRVFRVPRLGTRLLLVGSYQLLLKPLKRALEE